MTEQKIISKLDSIVAFADELKTKAAELRKELTAPVRQRRSKISEQEIAQLLARRNKNRNKKATSTVAIN